MTKKTIRSLELFAQEYTDEFETTGKDAAKAIAERRGVPKDTVDYWVELCRDAGLLQSEPEPAKVKKPATVAKPSKSGK